MTELDGKIGWAWKKKRTMSEWERNDDYLITVLLDAYNIETHIMLRITRLKFRGRGRMVQLANVLQEKVLIMKFFPKGGKFFCRSEIANFLINDVWEPQIVSSTLLS
jgi:hypothetical protein